MTDIVLSPLSSGYNLSVINSNFSLLGTTINSSVLWTVGGNNQMSQDLDMNGHRVLNILSDPSVPNSMVTYAGGDARYYRIGNIPTAVGANDAVGFNQMNLAIAAAAGGSFPADVALYSRLDDQGASPGSALIGYTSGTVKAQLDSNATSISTLNTNVGTNTSSISTLNTTVGGHTTSISTINGQISTLQGQTAVIANLGKVALATISADQSIPNSTLTTLTLNTFTTNTLGATFTGGGIVIPAGVTKVRIIGNLFYTSNATGYRDLVIYKNGSTLAGLPYMVQNAVSSSIGTLMNGSSCILTVTTGDIFYLVAGQTSGGALNVLAGGQTWLAVEAIN